MIVNLSEVINTVLLNNLGNCLKGEKKLFKVVKTTLWWNISTHVFADTYHFLKRCRVFFLFLKKAKECVILKAGLSTTNIVAYDHHKKVFKSLCLYSWAISVVAKRLVGNNAFESKLQFHSFQEANFLLNIQLLTWHTGGSVKTTFIWELGRTIVAYYISKKCILNLPQVLLLQVPNWQLSFLHFCFLSIRSIASFIYHVNLM